jgi:hypothetical protein
MPSPSRQSTHSPLVIVFALVMVVATLAVILEFDGPFKGWAGRLRERLHPSPPPASQPSVSPPSAAPTATHRPQPAAAPPTSPAPVETAIVVPEPTEEEAPAPEKSDLEKRYDEIYQRILAELPQPRIGDPCQLRLVQGGVVQGTIEKLEPGRITLRVQYGTMAYPVHVIDPRDALRLFPTIAARYRALAELRRQSQDQSTQPEEPAPTAPTAPRPPPTTTAAAAPQPLPPAPQTTTPVTSRLGTFQYDPTPGPTPEELKPTLAAFGDWLKSQHRRIGGRIADRIFARQQAGRAVLYLQLDPLFLDQDYSVRFQTAEGIQIFWGLRCESSGVARSDRAHVVLLDQAGNIVGGSRLEDPAVIWLSEK